MELPAGHDVLLEPRRTRHAVLLQRSRPGNRPHLHRALRPGVALANPRVSLLPVTGYPGAHDFTGEALHPADDGVHIVDVETGERRLLVSFAQLADLVRPTRPDVDRKALFINHSLWSRDDSRVYFYVRADFDDRDERIDIPCTIRPDGGGLTMLDHVGGHPEWRDDRHIIGVRDGRQVVYDVLSKRVVETLGTLETFPQPGGDIALSPDGRWFVNGHSEGEVNIYTVLRLADGSWDRLAPV
jgi:hypothetical protein